MKKQFDESKHKRNELGRFAEMSASEISNAIKQEIGEHDFIIAKNGRVKYEALTPKQWSLWYSEQTQREKSYLLCEHSERRMVNVEGIFILTNGTFVKPKVEAIYKLDENDLALELKGVLDTKYGKNKKSNGRNG